MINIEAQSHLVNVAVLGQFTLADFKELEEAVMYKIKFEGRVNLLLDLRDMAGLTVDVAWEEIKFSRAHRFDLWKIAFVAENPVVSWSTWFAGLFANAESQVFDDYNLAKEWVTTV
ncbi:MAG: STAS/SEC14 domain-containing protein [Sulfuricella sp.]|nr:STAS/SEC14 domain-containing protein [Sulfuricella sp.]